MLISVFGDDVKCRTVEVNLKRIVCHSILFTRHYSQDSFTSPTILSERFAMSASKQYYQPLKSPLDLIIYLQQKTCGMLNRRCKDQIALLREASSIDFDFDAITHALQITAVWPQGPGGESWDETIKLQSKSDSVEIGVLNTEKPTEPEELSLGGFLTVLGEDDKPSMYVPPWLLSII